MLPRAPLGQTEATDPGRPALVLLCLLVDPSLLAQEKRIGVNFYSLGLVEKLELYHGSRLLKKLEL